MSEPRDDAPERDETHAPDDARSPAPPAAEEVAAPELVTAADETAPDDAPPEPAAPAPPPPPRRGLLDALAEPPETPVEVPRATLAASSRRDFLLFGLGTLAAALGGWWVLPERAKSRLLPGAAHDRLDTLAARVGLSRERRDRTLDRALTLDDDVAEALYSKDRRVRTYERSQTTYLRNNYNGATPGPEYLDGWSLTLSGLASGRIERLALADLTRRFAAREQVTRFVCVEGWSAVAWWGGPRFADLLDAYPPAPGARWAALRSDVNLDGRGRPDPYYVSIDLATARHPQVLLATHHDGAPLTVEHGAPLRLLVPMKLGLKNIKAITSITYVADQPADYWGERGYSKYDGL